jgi:DNA polymerase
MTVRKREGGVMEVIAVLERTTPATLTDWRDGRPHVLHRDFETRGVLDLAIVGAHKYAADPRTEIRIVGYAVDDGPVELWLPGDRVPPAWFEAAYNSNWVVSAHNDAFESAIERRILARFGFPPIPLERHRCTQAAALALALPADLGLLAKVLRLKHQKDHVGERVMLQMSRPRRPRKGEDPAGLYYHDDPEKFGRLCAYNRVDVEVERELHSVLPPLAEPELWYLDQCVNERGIFFDRALVEAALQVMQAARPEIDAELAQVTGGAVTAATQVARLVGWLRRQGCEAESLDKLTVRRLLAGELTPPVRRVFELRVMGGQAAARKLGTLLKCLDADDRARGLYRFHAASTGRWSGARFQPQNLRRPQIDDVDAAVAVVATGDYAAVRAQYPDPLATVGDILRATICAPPGKVLVGADFSGIEARVLAWLAGEQRKLETFRRFDASAVVQADPYVIVASWIFRTGPEAITAEQRHVGKCCELAFGYQGGLGAFRRIAPDATFTDNEIEQFKLAWRAAHPAIEKFWRTIDRITIDAVRRPNDPLRYGPIAIESNGAFLWLTLPSGRELAYPQPRLVEDREFGRRFSIAYQDNAAGQWRGERLYGGKTTENIVSAIARDLLAAAMLRLENAGFPVVFHCHDEAVCEVPEGSVDLVNFTKLMTVVPTWAAGLPLAAKAWSGRRYTK